MERYEWRLEQPDAIGWWWARWPNSAACNLYAYIVGPAGPFIRRIGDSDEHLAAGVSWPMGMLFAEAVPPTADSTMDALASRMAAAEEERASNRQEEGE
ncbi:hypothetical protein HQ535_08995 [bacterium]|nr:hypothetical protein [bacterium]